MDDHLSYFRNRTLKRFVFCDFSELYPFEGQFQLIGGEFQLRCVAHDRFCLFQILEPIFIEALIAQPAIERFDVRILDRFAGLNIFEIDFASIKQGSAFETKSRMFESRRTRVEF